MSGGAFGSQLISWRLFLSLSSSILLLVLWALLK